MPITVKPGKYLIERSRRRTVGVIAHVGTGGSVPKPVQAAVNAYADSIHAGSSKTIQSQERAALHVAMKAMAGRWLVLSSVGMRWADSQKAIGATLRNSGWKPPADQLAALLEE